MENYITKYSVKIQGCHLCNWWWGWGRNAGPWKFQGLNKLRQLGLDYLIHLCALRNNLFRP